MPGPPHHRSRARARGITLIELVIALAIASLLFGATVMGVGALTGAQAKSTATELGGTIRYLYDAAALSGRTCRLVFDLPDERDGESDGRVSYRAECAEGALTTGRDRQEQLETEKRAREEAERTRPFERRRSGYGALADEPTLEEVLGREQARVEAQGRFAEFRSPEVRPRKLPAGVQVSVWTRQQRKAIESGPAHLYFFPQGYTERAQLVIRQGDNAWTLTVAPLTGKTTVVGEALEVPSP